MNETELERTDEKTETDAAQSTETPKEKETVEVVDVAFRNS